ncbi:MAG: FkbM family methyltransferase [Chlorobiaceae bacterium]|nr:FkbM family methyltransferase [Chlorobiaceae bacterium]MBA4310389.1 FkbM family methyltransferase [Chlorobiaceae bacterium]
MVNFFITLFFANRFSQLILEKITKYSLYLGGVGSGRRVKQSGEKSVIKLINKYSEPFTIFDVGANKGQYLSMLVEELENKKFNIHSFEPSKYSFEMMKQKFNEVPNIKLNNIGLSDSEGEFLLYSDGDGSELASLTKRKLDHFKIDFSKSEKVQVSTIDDYCATNSIKHIHLLKIDVEGHEMNVLKGAKKMFEKKSIDVVTFEFGGCNIDTRTFFRDFFYFFTEHNMLIYRITSSGFHYPIKRYREMYEQFNTTNYVAVKSQQKD